MLKEVAGKTRREKRIAVSVRCGALSEVLENLLRLWKFEIGKVADTDCVLLGEKGLARPGIGQGVIWLTGDPGREESCLALPLDVERLWQCLEHYFHELPRMNVRLDAELAATVMNDDEVLATTINGLSAMGCRLTLKRELVRDEPVLVRLDTGDGEMSIESRVIYAIPGVGSSGGAVRTGILFHGIDNRQRDRLKSFLVCRFLEMAGQEMADDRFRTALAQFDLPPIVREKLAPDPIS